MNKSCFKYNKIHILNETKYINNILYDSNKQKHYDPHNFSQKEETSIYFN